MRLWIGSLAALLAIATPFSAYQRDAATVLADMRQAMGGAAALDAVKTFSANGNLTLRTPMGPRQMSLEWFAILPDHFLEIRRDSGFAGPMSYSIVYYNGLRGDTPIRKTDAEGMPMPPDIRSDPQVMLQMRRQEFAKLALVFFGASAQVYPLTFSYIGQEQAEGRTFDVITATAADGYSMVLHVDAGSHLPASVTWKAERPFTMTTTSTVTTRGNEVVSRSPETPLLATPPPGPMVDYRWLLSDYKTQDGVLWPRKIEIVIPGGFSEEIRLRGVKINPKIDAKRFNVR